jgi:indolepyruvate ferredoxin oxidoreductase alpha subunit
MVERGFELSEASNTPVIMELRIRACHVRGSFPTRANRAPAVSTKHLQDGPPAFLYERLAHPPEIFRQEKLKTGVRMPAAREFIVAQDLNETFDGAERELGIIVQGGLYNNLVRALDQAGLANCFGETRIPILALNVVYPLVPEQIREFCAGKRAVLVVEEGQPEFIEQEIATTLRRGDLQTRLHGKDVLPLAGEYTAEVILRGLEKFVAAEAPALASGAGAAWVAKIDAVREQASRALGTPLPARPPNFCVGCPERPVFAAIKLAQRDVGPWHIGTDIGCHALATFEPFSLGNSILGYGMSLAATAGVAPTQSRRTMAIMGDGGFWHNGFLSGVSSALLNGSDSVLVIMKNGYSSATGTQELLSSPPEEAKQAARERSAAAADTTIESTLKGAGVKWLRTVHTYRVSEMAKTLREAFQTPEPGLKVIVAEGECQLERQRRIRPLIATALKNGQRAVRTRFGVDEDVCSGDHSCIRLSGCPSLTVKDPSDPLKVDPVAHVNNACVGCGLCGEVAHAAILCPSFFRAEIVQNPGWWDRTLARARGTVIGWLQPA